jgi:hypothetical protein
MVLFFCLAGCFQTCSISPEVSDSLYFSRQLLEQYCPSSRFVVLELQISSRFPDKEKLVNGKHALIMRDDMTDCWAVKDITRSYDESEKNLDSCWVLIDPINSDFQQKLPLSAGDARIAEFEESVFSQPLAALGTTNVVDLGQVFAGIENCHAVFIAGKTKFQVFGKTNNTVEAYSYRNALKYGEASSSHTRCIAADDDFLNLLKRLKHYEN